MKQLLVTLFLIVLFSCGKEKMILLPEIENAKITDVKDVSPAYIFYDETKPDSVELNRKNLIISTNWLVNVDKRLSLKQALPSIIKLQDKKRNAKMHKNENARNYYTCSDTSIKNLGFIDFTDVIYIDNDEEASLELNTKLYHLVILNKKDIQIITPNNGNEFANIENLPNKLESLIDKKSTLNLLTLAFHKKLNFQDYISFKSILSNIKIENFKISNSEFITD